VGIEEIFKMPDDMSSFFQGLIVGIILLVVLVFLSATIMNVFAGYGYTIDIRSLVCGKYDTVLEKREDFYALKCEACGAERLILR